MKQVIEICQAEGIQMVASFYLKDAGEEGGPMHCTSALLGPGEPEPILKDALRVIRHGWGVVPGSFAMTITSREEPTA